MTDAISYCFYGDAQNERDAPPLKFKITIRGGAGLPSNRSGFGEQTEDINHSPLWTADGVVTRISADQKEHLMNHPHFKRHLAAGRVRIVSNDVTGNHKAVRNISRDMPELDSHALLTRDTAPKRIKISTANEQSYGNESHRI